MNKRIIAILSLMIVVCSCLFCAVACKKDEDDEACKHFFNAWSSYTQATCEKAGEDMRECRQCGFREFRKIDAKGHSLAHCSASKATCEKAGHDAYDYCTDCDYTTYTETSPALGHDIINYDGQEANCLHVGWQPYEKCTRCGYSTYEEIPLKEHNFDSETLVCKECSTKGYTEGLSYTLVSDENESHYVVTGMGDATSENITIPYKINGIGVTEIAGNAFQNERIRSITIPDSVTLIGQGAFSKCFLLESITLPFVGNRAGVTENDTYQYPFGYIFGTSSYTGGTQTKQYYYGSSTTSTTSTIYYIPSTLKSVTITGGNIPHGAFENCSGLTSVTIPNSVTSIGCKAFYNCSGLTSITLLDSVTSIGDDAFYGCNNLKYNEYDNAYYLGSSDNPYLVLVKAKSTSITSCTINENTKVIAGSAFEDCSSLTSITIPDRVTSN